MPSYRTAFISHAHADNVRCASIAALLAARGIDLWIDLTNLQKGHALSTDITHELVRRQALVLMVTDASDASPWVGDELNKYLAYSLDPAWRMVDGQRRLIIPVRLEPIQLRPDAEESNWAKVFDRFWVDGVGKSDEQVADAIAAALRIATDRRDPPTPPPSEWEEIGIRGRLYDLGFRGWRVRRTGVEFILPPTCPIAAGAFEMGSADSDKDAQSNEKPQYRIPVGAFAIGKHPVTVEEYRLYLKANPGVAVPETYSFPRYVAWCAPEWRGKDLSWQAQQTRPDHPVVCVTWFNARDYATWLAQTTGQPWRLPTEAEWEKAARWDEAKQRARSYPWGDAWDKSRANTRDGGPRQTTPVGSYPSGASPYGAQDMAGNVWEWTSSLYNVYPYDPATSEDLGNGTGARVLRGGSWYYVPQFARAAFRGGFPRSIWGSYCGFRVVGGVGAGTS